MNVPLCLPSIHWLLALDVLHERVGLNLLTCGAAFDLTGFFGGEGVLTGCLCGDCPNGECVLTDYLCGDCTNGEDILTGTPVFLGLFLLPLGRPFPRFSRFTAGSLRPFAS